MTTTATQITIKAAPQKRVAVLKYIDIPEKEVVSIWPPIALKPFEFATEHAILDSSAVLNPGRGFELAASIALRTKPPRFFAPETFLKDPHFSVLFRTSSGDAGVDGLNFSELLCSQYKDWLVLGESGVAPFCSLTAWLRTFPAYESFRFVFACPSYTRVQPAALALLQRYCVELFRVSYTRRQGECGHHAPTAATPAELVTVAATPAVELVPATTEPSATEPSATEPAATEPAAPAVEPMQVDAAAPPPARNWSDALKPFQVDAKNRLVAFLLGNGAAAPSSASPPPSILRLQLICGGGKSSIARSSVVDVLEQKPCVVYIFSNDNIVHDQHVSIFGPLGVHCVTVQGVLAKFMAGDFTLFDVHKGGVPLFVFVDEAHHYVLNLWALAVAAFSGNMRAQHFFRMRYAAIEGRKRIVRDMTTTMLRNVVAHCSAPPTGGPEPVVPPVLVAAPPAAPPAAPFAAPPASPTFDPPLSLRRINKADTVPVAPTVLLSATFATGTPIDIDVPSSAPIEAGLVVGMRVTILQIDDLHKRTEMGVVRAKCDALVEAKYSGALVYFGGGLVFWNSCEKAVAAAKHCRSKGATSIAVTGNSPKEVKALFAQERIGATLLDHDFVHVCGMLTEGANMPELGLTVFGDDRRTMMMGLQSMYRSNRSFPGKVCADSVVFPTERGEIDTAAVSKEMRDAGDASLFASEDVSEEEKMEKLLVDRRVRVISQDTLRRLRAGFAASDSADVAEDEEDAFLKTTYRVVLSTLVSDLRGGGLEWPSLDDIEAYLFSIDELPPKGKLVLVAEGKRPMDIRRWWTNRVKYFIQGDFPPSNYHLPAGFVDRIKSERPPFFVKWEGKRTSAPSLDEILAFLCATTKLPSCKKLVVVAAGKLPYDIGSWWGHRILNFVDGAEVPSTNKLSKDFVETVEKKAPFFPEWKRAYLAKLVRVPSSDEIGFHICSLTKEQFDALMNSKEPVSVPRSFTNDEVTRPVLAYQFIVAKIVSFNWTGIVKQKSLKLSSGCKEALEEKDFFMARVAAAKARSEKFHANKKRKAEEAASSAAASSSSSSAAPAPASGGSKKRKIG